MNLPMHSLKLMSQKEAMKLVGIGSRETLDRWVRQGLFPPPIKVGGGLLRWVPAEVEAWLEAKKRERRRPVHSPTKVGASARRTLRHTAAPSDKSSSDA